MTAVPSQVWESGEITKVNLSKNSIEELPAQLSSSASLQVTVFSTNTNSISSATYAFAIKHVVLLKISCYLCILQTLILSRNKIKDWPGEILKSLPALVCLKLDNNLLKQVGDVCGEKI